MIPTRRLASMVAKVPRPLRALLLGSRTVRDGFVLDRDLQWLLALDRRLNVPSLTGAPPAETRATFSRTAVLFAPTAEAATEDSSFPGPAGPVPIRTYRPAGLPSGPAPCLVYVHGGGFVVGDLDTHDGVCRALAARARCVVIAVHYRRAPEEPFPAATDDVYAALCWVHAQADVLGLDRERIAIGGDSAGGNLSAVACLRARDEDAQVSPCLQLLVYPGVDFSSDAPSKETFSEGFLLSRADIDRFRDAYVPEPDQRWEPYASPLLADLEGVAPACVLTAGFDPLRDEGRAYARKLADAGVPTEEHCFPGLVHGFLNLAGVFRACESALDVGVEALARAFRRAPARV